MDLYKEKDGHDMIQEDLDCLIDDLKKLDKNHFKYYIECLEEIKIESFGELEEIEEAISKEEQKEIELERREHIASVIPNNSLYRM